jgi:hypothetical protein
VVDPLYLNYPIEEKEQLSNTKARRKSYLYEYGPSKDAGTSGIA